MRSHNHSEDSLQATIAFARQQERRRSCNGCFPAGSRHGMGAECSFDEFQSRGCMKHFRCLRECIIAGVLLLLIPQMTYAKTWLWSEELVDAQPAKFTSIAIDQQGDLHLLYSSENGAFQYGFRPAGESKWDVMPLEGGTGFPNIKLDSSGNPHACLAINSSGVIK